MDLSDQDKLRLNVLFARPLQAIRIDESRMEIHALSENGEAIIRLNPGCKDEKYLKIVRQWLSSKVLGSPGGYPVFLRRWTRMGPARQDSLEKLLLLGEPEAVVAVVHASGLTNEIARRAWWCAPNSDNARCLLECDAVAKGSMGPDLAQFLVEFLPFEESSMALMKSVRLILQPNLIDEQTKLDIWKRGKRRNAFYIGFIRQCPHSIPVKSKPHPNYDLVSTCSKSGKLAARLTSIFSAHGQAGIEVIQTVLGKPNDQEVAVEIFNTIGEYFDISHGKTYRWRELEELENFTSELKHQYRREIDALVNQCPDAKTSIDALLYLSMVNESLLDPVFGVTDAIGSVMRKRIAHLTGPITQQLKLLQQT